MNKWRDSYSFLLSFICLKKILLPCSWSPGVRFLGSQPLKLGRICSWAPSQDISLVYESACQGLSKGNSHCLLVLTWVLRLIVVHEGQSSETGQGDIFIHRVPPPFSHPSPFSFPFIPPLPGFVSHSPLSPDDEGRNLETVLILDVTVLFPREETQECAAWGRQWSSFTGWIFSPSGVVLGWEASGRNEVGGWSLDD